MDEVPNIEGHLIIMGKSINNLFDLIRPLRARYLGSLKYIVILYPDVIPHAVWQRIAIFEGICGGILSCCLNMNKPVPVEFPVAALAPLAAAVAAAVLLCLWSWAA